MHESYKKWLSDGCPKVYCKCECNREITIKKYCRYKGISKYISGHNKGNLDNHLSKDQKQRISNGHKGQVSGMKDKYHTKETKQKMREKKLDIYCGENNPNWKGGVSFEPYCEKFNEKKREEVRNEYNRKCYICGEDEKNNKYKNGKQCKLSVHHVNNDKKQGCNGKRWKLVPLCIHCHNSKEMRILWKLYIVQK